MCIYSYNIAIKSLKSDLSKVDIYIGLHLAYLRATPDHVL